jgi:F-type H+-transporting ATPase subunit delta
MAEARHSTVLDTGLQYIGTVYAKALIAAAEKSGTTEKVLEELDAFVSDVLDAFPKFEATLGSPRVPFESKERALDRAFANKMSPQLLNFLKVLTRRGRFEAVRAVRLAARKIYNDLRGRVEVHLTTAEPLDASTRDLVLTKLKAALKTEIDLKTYVDPELLGGLTIRVGDTVYDGSLANQLARLRNELVATATQRLRAESDRFAVAN